MPALDPLGNGHLAFARQQRHAAHLALVYADRVVRLLQCARCQVKLDFLNRSFFLGFGLTGLGGRDQP